MITNMMMLPLQWTGASRQGQPAWHGLQDLEKTFTARKQNKVRLAFFFFYAGYLMISIQ